MLLKEYIAQAILDCSKFPMPISMVLEIQVHPETILNANATGYENQINVSEHVTGNKITLTIDLKDSNE